MFSGNKIRIFVDIEVLTFRNVCRKSEQNKEIVFILGCVTSKAGVETRALNVKKTSCSRMACVHWKRGVLRNDLVQQSLLNGHFKWEAPSNKQTNKKKPPKVVVWNKVGKVNSTSLRLGCAILMFFNTSVRKRKKEKLGKNLRNAGVEIRSVEHEFKALETSGAKQNKKNEE